MKVIVDDKIPYIKGIIEQLADEVIYLPGKEIVTDAVQDADALIIRTRTRCDRALLEGSNVKFIGTATIGFDHIDTIYCEKKGIVWANCPGCNAGAVEQYLHSALLLLQREKNVCLKNTSIGIVGVGHVGERVRCLCESLGMHVLLNDPPRADSEEKGFESLQTIVEKCEIITFHVPLIRGGLYKTFHLADGNFFSRLRKEPYIINTSRGEVIDTKAILSALDKKQIAGAIIDVWENEPNISLELLRKVFIGTPHIAGYSVEGKMNATRMVLEAYCRFFGKGVDFEMPECVQSGITGHGNKEFQQLQLYDPRRDYRALLAHPASFEQLRENYSFRREK